MQPSLEYEIWDSIVNSAKTKFDYNHILSLFKQTDSEIIDKFLFHILVAFACGEDHETISTNLLMNYSKLVLTVPSIRLTNLLRINMRN